MTSSRFTKKTGSDRKTPQNTEEKTILLTGPETSYGEKAVFYLRQIQT